MLHSQYLLISMDLSTLWTNILRLLAYDPTQPMLFSSGTFWALFLLFLPIYAKLKGRRMDMVVYVVAFSLYFYYKSSGIYFLLLLFASVSDYWIGFAIAASKDQVARKQLVALSAIINLGMLAYFKYTNFFIEIANGLVGAGFLDFKNIFLPVGISFFVFQSMSYTIDIYRGQLRPLDSWLDYLFYLLFFCIRYFRLRFQFCKGFYKHTAGIIQGKSRSHCPCQYQPFHIADADINCHGI